MSHKKDALTEIKSERSALRRDYLLMPLLTTIAVLAGQYFTEPWFEERKLIATERWKLKQAVLSKAISLVTQQLESLDLNDPEHPRVKRDKSNLRDAPKTFEVNILYAELLGICKNPELTNLFSDCFKSGKTVKNWGDFINAARSELDFEPLNNWTNSNS